MSSRPSPILASPASYHRSRYVSSPSTTPTMLSRRTTVPLPHPPTSSKRPLPPGPGPLDRYGQKLDKEYITKRLGNHQNSSAMHGSGLSGYPGRATPLKAVHGTFSDHEMSPERGSLTKTLERNASNLINSHRRTNKLGGILSDEMQSLHIGQDRESRDRSPYSPIDVTPRPISSKRHYISRTQSLDRLNQSTPADALAGGGSHLRSLQRSQSPRYEPSLSYNTTPKRRFSSTQENTSFTTANAHPRITLKLNSENGLAGLRNLGLTCYANAVIQMLSKTSPFLDYIINENYHMDLPQKSLSSTLFYSFCKIIQEIWKVQGTTRTRSSALSLDDFLTKFRHQASHFKQFTQNDSEEFLTYVLSIMHDELNQVKHKPKYNDDIPSSLSDSEMAIEAWRRYTSREKSFITETFAGQSKSILRCQQCDYRSITFDVFWDLPLPLPEKGSRITLMDCLKNFTGEEDLEQVYCEKCKKKQRMKRKIEIQRFPEILIIQLKRFKAVPLTSSYVRISKIRTTVNFSDSLDLASFSAVRQPDKVLYRLYGVVKHQGTSSEGGHYFALGKHPISHQWYLFNDSNVAPDHISCDDAYLLFFERKPVT